MSQVLSRRIAVLLIVITIGTVLWVNAGDLNPPAGSVAPTMKPLAELEPRIVINATNTPGDADSVYKITQPGSYYLTGNVFAPTSINGIEIAASRVTLDLMGFEVLGNAGNSRGIVASVANSISISVRNGTIRNFGQRAIDLSLSSHNLLSDLRIFTCTHGGIQAGAATTVTDCTISSCEFGIQVGDVAVIRDCTFQSDDVGISAASGAVITNCSVRFSSTSGINVTSGSSITNTVCTQNIGKGFVVGDADTLANCSSYLNNSDGFVLGKSCTIKNSTSHGNNGGGDGFEIGEGTCVIDCTSYDNEGYGILGSSIAATVSGCTVYKNSQSGISIGTGVVTRCESSNNNFDGIRVGSDCRITDNKCGYNGPGGFAGAGIHVLQANCHIEGNFVAFNDIGIDVDSSPSLIIRNIARVNSTVDYDTIAGNMTGTILFGASAMNASTNSYNNLRMP